MEHTQTHQQQTYLQQKTKTDQISCASLMSCSESNYSFIYQIEIEFV